MVIGFKTSEAHILQEQDGRRLLSAGRCSSRILNSRVGGKVAATHEPVSQVDGRHMRTPWRVALMTSLLTS